MSKIFSKSAEVIKANFYTAIPIFFLVVLVVTIIILIIVYFCITQPNLEAQICTSNFVKIQLTTDSSLKIIQPSYVGTLSTSYAVGSVYPYARFCLNTNTTAVVTPVGQSNLYLYQKMDNTTIPPTFIKKLHVSPPEALEGENNLTGYVPGTSTPIPYAFFYNFQKIQGSTLNPFYLVDDYYASTSLMNTWNFPWNSPTIPGAPNTSAIPPHGPFGYMFPSTNSFQ